MIEVFVALGEMTLVSSVIYMCFFSARARK